MNATLKLALPAVAFVIGTLMACSAPESTEPVQAHVDTDQVGTMGCPRGIDCTPPKTNRFGNIGALTVGGTLVETPPPPPPWEQGAPISCSGPSPAEPGAYYRVVDGQCWSVGPYLQLDGGIGSGFTRISLYLCAQPYSVSHCNTAGDCWCWYY